MKKKSILAILMFLVTLISFAQEIVPLEEKYDYIHNGMPYYLQDVNNLLDKFAGEWEFSDNTHYLKIKLYKIEGVNKPSYPKETYDEIRSFIFYKEKQASNWVVVYDTYPTSYTTADLNNQNFNNGVGIKGNLFGKNYNELVLNYYEPAPPCTDQLSCFLNLTYSNTIGVPQLQWQEDTSCYGYDTTSPCSSTAIHPKQVHRIPLQFILNKL